MLSFWQLCFVNDPDLILCYSTSKLPRTTKLRYDLIMDRYMLFKFIACRLENSVTLAETLRLARGPSRINKLHAAYA